MERYACLHQTKLFITKNLLVNARWSFRSQPMHTKLNHYIKTDWKQKRRVLITLIWHVAIKRWLSCNRTRYCWRRQRTGWDNVSWRGGCIILKKSSQLHIILAQIHKKFLTTSRSPFPCRWAWETGAASFVSSSKPVAFIRLIHLLRFFSWNKCSHFALKIEILGTCGSNFWPEKSFTAFAHIIRVGRIG